MIVLPDIDLEYLRIPKQLVEKVHHEPNYIHIGTGKKATRKIFSNVKYDSFEKEHISQLQTRIKQSQIIFPQRIIEENRLLRFLYSGGFEIDKSFDILKSHFEWLSTPENFKIIPKTQEYLEKGAVYLAGRDKKFRPMIVINIPMLYGKDFELSSFMNALYAIFNICREIIFVPGKIENWVLLIETAEMSMFSFPFDVLGTIIKNASLQYSGTMEKIYITNPSTSFNMTWALIANFLDEKTLNKINKLSKKEFSKMFEYFPGDQLEMKYGGTMPNIKKYWPPIDPLKSLKAQLEREQEKENEKNGQIMTYSDFERRSKSPLRDTKRRIFDDENLSFSPGPMLQEEINEISSFRKSKKEAFTKDLYQNFPTVSKKSEIRRKNSFVSNEGSIDGFTNWKTKEDFQSVYRVLHEKKSVEFRTGTMTTYSKRDSAFCGLCCAKREDENGEKVKSSTLSVCNIF